MASLDQFEETTTITAFLLGASGAGKTGSLMALAASGYTLWIYACEKNTVATLYNLWKTVPAYKNIPADRINIINLAPDFTAIGAKFIPRANGWDNFKTAMFNWDRTTQPKPGDTAFIYTLGPKDVVVVDTLSAMSDIAADYVLSISQRPDEITRNDYPKIQSLIDNAMRAFCSKSMKAHFITLAHVQVSENPNQPGAMLGFPKTAGSGLAKTIARHVNNILYLEATPGPDGMVRKIYTKPKGVVQPKTTVPLTVKSEYPIETGLADFFRDALEKPKE